MSFGPAPKRLVQECIIEFEHCVVLQSAAPIRPQWVDGCLLSVQRWAAKQGFEYRFRGDEVFDALPDWYRSKMVSRPPILADLARLLWIRELHTEGAAWVLWLDADTLVVDPDWRPKPGTHTVFGEECWLEWRDDGRVSRHIQPHNAFVLMHRNSPVRDFLIYAIESMIGRVDPEHVAPQMVGPKLLKALNNLVAFELDAQAGALSPDLVEALSSNGHQVDGRKAQRLLKRWPDGRRLALANLCSSLSCKEGMREALIENPDQLHCLA